jgi:hypothetical protein
MWTLRREKLEIMGTRLEELTAGTQRESTRGIWTTFAKIKYWRRRKPRLSSVDFILPAARQALCDVSGLYYY